MLREALPGIGFAAFKDKVIEKPRPCATWGYGNILLKTAACCWCAYGW